MANKRDQIYRCRHCGNIVEVINPGGPVPVCCGDEMTLLEGNTVDAAVEKHVPVVEKIDGGYKVTVGSVAHPMGEDHHIAWIELVGEGRVYRKYLEVGAAPEATFMVDEGDYTAREYCNLHGLWKS